ncbi:MAG: glycosyltransferase family 9 protein [Psychroserpens sp.]|uniref:glycosyltransferase family 9 protein n=1 Tax=Psychroserpens sp. TaxID=2020870 RepID=UPI003CB0FF4B
MPKPKHILVIRLSAMGDVAMTVPVLRAFIAQYPEVQLTVLTISRFTPFFRDLSNVTVFEADLKNSHKGIIGLWKLSRELRAIKFNVVADLHNVLRSKVLKFFFFGKRVVQIDKGRNEKKTLTQGKNFTQLKTTHQRYADVFETLGFEIDLENPKFPKKANLNITYLEKIGRDVKPWIGVAPFAAFQGKMYPIDLIETVIVALSQNNKVILFGAGDEEALLLNKISKHNNVINLAGQFSLAEELDIISNLDVMLAMDSGNAHIAAMLGVKVITLWGVTHPFAGFLPYNQAKDSAILANRDAYPKIPTSIYGNKVPTGYENVMRSIHPNDVIERIKSALK